MWASGPGGAVTAEGMSSAMPPPRASGAGREWRGLLDRRAPSGGEGRLSGQGLRRAVREHGPAPPRRVGLQTF